MNVTVNGAVTRLDDGTTVADLIGSTVDDCRYVAVALNAAVVPRGSWATTTLTDGDSVEVLAPVAGG